MADVTPRVKTQAEVPQSVVEYTLTFASPIIRAGGEPSPIIASALEALEASGFSIEGVEVKTGSEKLNDYAIIFKRTNPPAPPMSFTLFLGKIFISAGNLDWEGAETFISTATAGVRSILEATGAKIKSQVLGLGMHVQFKNRSRIDVMAPLLAPQALTLLDGELTCPGIIVKREKCTVIVEASVVYANGIFVRLFREHPGDTTLQEIAKVLHKDEEQLFEVLGLEGIL